MNYCFDEEPFREGYPCHVCGGSITKNEDLNLWECDGCDFQARETHKKKEADNEAEPV